MGKSWKTLLASNLLVLVGLASSTTRPARYARQAEVSVPAATVESSTATVCEIASDCGGALGFCEADVAKRGFITVPRGPKIESRGFLATLDYYKSEDLAGNGDGFYKLEREKTSTIKELIHRQTGRLSSAAIHPFDTPSDGGELRPFLKGLHGCTSVVIIGEKGCWISHFWQGNSFDQNDETFQDTVIRSIEEGDNNPNMKSPFDSDTSRAIPELAIGEGDEAFKPEIFISTPYQEGSTSDYMYDARVTLMEQALTGEGRAFAGNTIKRRGYTIIHETDDQKAAGKVLIQYTNDQTDEDGNPKCPQSAMYRVWFEDQMMTEHEWTAVGNQVASSTKRRRDEKCDDKNRRPKLPDQPTATPTPTPDPNKPSATADPNKPVNTPVPDPNAPVNTPLPDPNAPVNTPLPDPNKPTLVPDPNAPVNTPLPDPAKPSPAVPDPAKPSSDSDSDSSNGRPKKGKGGLFGLACGLLPIC